MTTTIAPLIGPTVACLSVVMPAYNEAATIDQIIPLVLAQPSVQELIVVDDGSSDGTLDKIQAWRARDGRIKLCRHEFNQGKGAAVRTGIAQATAAVVVIQDADLEYAPADYALLLTKITDGAQVVYGTRFASQPMSGGWNWHRSGNRLLTALCNLITGQRLTDEATCYKMFRREVLDQIQLRETGFGFCPEVTAKVNGLGLRIEEVPISYHGRSVAEGKKIRLWHGVEACWCLVKYGMRKPTRNRTR